MLLKPHILKFKYRKILHFSLITSIVLLQLVLLVLFYNEIYNDSKLDRITAEIEAASKIRTVLKRSKINQYKAQNDFENFISSNQAMYFNSFKKNTTSLTERLDSLSSFSKTNPSWKKFISDELIETQKKSNLKEKLDSVFTIKLPKDLNLSTSGLEVKPYNYKDVLNSIQVETSKEVDTVKKKGFFSRLGKALAGKVDVQKEKVNILVTMKFGKEVTTGDVTAQLSKAFEITNNYYKNAFLTLQDKLQKKIEAHKNQEIAYAKLNFHLLSYSSKLLENYEKTLDDFTTVLTTQYDKQFQKNKKIRNYTIIALVVLVIIISIILFFFTKIAFKYEKQLYNAQKTIQRNLSFKNRIVGMISHEIRSPLSILSIYSNYINSKIKDKETKEVFDSIQFTTNSLLTLSNQILEYSKNEQGKMTIKKGKVDLNEQLNELVQSLKTLIEYNKNQFEYETNITTSCWVNTDIVKIYQLMYNTIGNANKYTTRGLIKLRCMLDSIDETKYNLLVEVKDNGMGISKADLEHVFDNFYQGAIHERNHFVGVGLGLTLCKDLVELFGGKMEITSEINQGTTVSFNINIDKTN